MKTLVNLFFFALICVGAIFGGLYSGNILLGYGVAAGVLLLAIFLHYKRNKKLLTRRVYEDAFTRHWRGVRNSR